MKRIVITLLFCLFALAMLTQTSLSNAEPFEVRNYRQGMSLEQVQRLAEKQGHTLQHDKNVKDRLTVQQDRADILYLGFCNDRVFEASYVVLGGFERFIKLLDSLTKQGLNKIDVSWRTDIGYDGKERFEMKVYFFPTRPEDNYNVTASLYATEGHGPHNSQISWTAVTGYCK